MTLEFIPVPIDMGMGIDTKTDPKLVVNGKLLSLQNGIFTQGKQITKRLGSNALSDAVINESYVISNPLLTKSYQNELVIGDGTRLFSYSEGVQGSAFKGYYSSVKTSNIPVSNQANSIYFQSSAILGNYCLVVYSGNSTLLATLIDLETNTRILSDYQVSSGLFGKVFILGTNLAILYIDTSDNVKLIILSISGTTVSFGSAISIGTSAHLVNGFPLFDVVTTSTGATLAYGTSSAIDLITINTSGSSTHTASISYTGTLGALVLTLDSTGNNWIYYLSSSNDNLEVAVYGPTLSTVASATTVAASISLSQVTAIAINAFSQYCYYTVEQSTPDTDTFNMVSKTITLSGSTLSVTSGPASMIGVDIVTKPILAPDGGIYIGLAYQSLVQPAIYFIQVDTARPAFILTQALNGATINSSLPPSLLFEPNIYGDVILTAVPLLTQEVTAASQSSSSDVGSGLFISVLISLDFANADVNQAVQVSDVLAINGGAVMSYDGGSVTELGFFVFPEITDLNSSSTGGKLTLGESYQWAIIYQWTDKQGNQYQSSPSFVGPVTISGSGSTGSASFYIRYLNLTSKVAPNSVEILVYRTTGGGSTFSLITPENNILNVIGDEAYLFSDTEAADSELSSDNVLYTDGGILANDPPPPAVLMTLHNNRIWVVDSQNPNTVWPSNQIVPLNGITFSGDLATNIDTRYGAITAIAEMDSNLVGFKGTAPFIVAGDAASTAGTGSTITNAQFIPSDAGCIESKSVLSTPFGILFKSQKGIYLLDRSLSVSYIGSEVEAFNSDTITSATMMQNKNQIRFLTSNSQALLFDYFFKQWAVEGFGGLSADFWNGNYVYCNSSGSILNEQSSYFLDGGSSDFSLSLQTAWLKTAAQGFQRVRLLEILGDYVNGASALHGLQISCNYDFGTGNIVSTQAAIYYFGQANASGPFQIRFFLPVQKCNAVQFVIQEVVTGDSAETIDLTNMTLEVGMKKGANKLSPGKSVGAYA
jgi:hypothetical protein